ncbi:sigma-54 dependent transcriptional regulator [bacterium]|nr:sigma-54 dependent transcriptional regulator [bacterium]
MSGTILVVDDEKNIRRVLRATLEREGYDVVEAESGEEALAILSRERVECVLTDLRMPGIDGMEVLARSLAADRELPIVMLTAHGTVNTAVEAMKRGAFDYLTKPFDKDELLASVARAVRQRDLARSEPDEPVGGASRNAAMRSLYAMIDKVAKSPTTVLITGESGTGKELVARMLHERGDRADKPYIRINCAAMPATLVESELFGYERGAFTGAVGSKPGRFELADKGTLFLDEIGTVPLETQVKLLRAIQEQEFERVGGVSSIRVNVRLVTATNVDLRQEVAAGRFREDLYYRLNVVHLRLPPLRERTEDLDMLARQFIERANKRVKKRVTGIGPDAWARLRAHAWPGNIRELENVIERAVLLAEGDTIAASDLPDELAHAAPGPGSRAVPAPGAEAAGFDLKQASREAAARVEIELIGAALKKTRGNVTQAAKILGLSRKGLQIKMREYGLDRDANEPA